MYFCVNEFEVDLNDSIFLLVMNSKRCILVGPTTDDFTDEGTHSDVKEYKEHGFITKDE